MLDAWPDAIWWKALFKALILPPTGLLLLSLAGLVMLRRRPRVGGAVAVVGIVALLVLSMPIVSFALARWLDSTPPLDPERAKSAQAIVILGGGMRRNAAEFGGDTLGRLTLERVRYGARVARMVGLPVLVSGGSLHGIKPEAAVMKDALEGEFGVPVRWTEDRSRTTHENAVDSAAILREAGVRKIVLVCHSFDVPRARAEFETQGLEVIPAPTGFPTRDVPIALEFVPSFAGLSGSYYVVYEIVANAVRALTPRGQAAGVR